jgi:DNA-binding transcriptional MerR regulator
MRKSSDASLRREDPMTEGGWEEMLDDPDAPLYPVGVVAELMGVDPQVVRGYDRRGIVVPDRSGAGQRRYSRKDIRRLSRAMELADEGIPGIGIERILTLEDELGRHG